jgi:hypothetical protein
MATLRKAALSRHGNAAIRSLKTAIVLLVLGTGAAMAATCLDEARRLGDTYGLTIDPPDAPSKEQPRAPSSRDLAQSGGVVEPPPTPDASVISPPRNTDSRMPTAPKVAPDSKKQGAASPNGLSAADLSMLQSILVAARDQARRGREDDCRESLQKARRLLRDSK